MARALLPAKASVGPCHSRLSARLDNVIISLQILWDNRIPKNSNSAREMSVPQDDDFASRAATYFVFIFLVAAIFETLLASLGG